MSDPVLIAVPPKGGSFDDVLKRLVTLHWVRPEVATAIRTLIKGDKRRVKLEEGLIQLWRASGCEYEATMRAADRFGHDLDDVDQALKRMRRWKDAAGKSQIDYTPAPGVEALLSLARQDADPEIREAALSLHIQLDLTRPGMPGRLVFNQLTTEVPVPGGSAVRCVLLGTDHEVTPTYLRKHKRDLSLTCYDAFHNTMLDVLDTPKVRTWKELTQHLKEANTNVRILGSLGLDDYLGHCVLMSERLADETVRISSGPFSEKGRWASTPQDPKLAILKRAPVLIDPAYEEVYGLLLDAQSLGIRLEAGPKDIETLCATTDRVAIYIVRSGSTVAVTPGLCVVGEELITSETIVAVNQEKLERTRQIGALVDALQPSTADRTPAWRTKLKGKLGERYVLAP